MNKQQAQLITDMQRELEIRDWDRIFIKIYDFFGKPFIKALAGTVESEKPEFILDCSISFIERYGLRHAIEMFERILGL